ncbi:site-specific DNA-methyltransferase, partial [Brachyspira intermedia]
EVQLIFTSPPYYNAREYSNYKSYKEYLNKMFLTLNECNRVLEDGRFIIINISPVITKRVGREFESIRYPIHFDFHNLLLKSNFYFVDEIQWIKPEVTVKNRNGGYQQTRMPLSYKPNCINESIMVYRKNSNFLLDKNIKKYSKSLANDKNIPIDTSNCWYISPKSSRAHPAVFPEELCRKILTYYSFKYDTVLDPFAGIGTFGKVALEMERLPILCEINKKYYDIILDGGFYDEI